jgi:hypothetical protein
MNSQIVYIFLMQLVLCAVCAVYYSTWYEENRSNTRIYLELDEFPSTSSPVVQFVIQFFT